MKSKAKSIALASAVKIEEPSGKRNVLQLPFVKVAQQTCFLLLNHQYKYIDSQ